MEDNEVLQNLLSNLDNIHCYKCGKSAAEFVRGRDGLLGCLNYTVEEGVEFLYWTCPKCMKGVKR